MRAAATRVRVSWASVTSEPPPLADVLNEKLHRLELAAPVRGMELESGSLQPLPPDSLDVLPACAQGAMRAAGAVPQLVERLRARLGEAAVYGVVPSPSIGRRPPGSGCMNRTGRRCASGVCNRRVNRSRCAEAGVAAWYRPFAALDESARAMLDEG